MIDNTICIIGYTIQEPRAVESLGEGRKSAMLLPSMRNTTSERG